MPEALNLLNYVAEARGLIGGVLKLISDPGLLGGPAP